MLESAAARWREFKSRLTTNYIIPYLDQPELLKFPPDDYRFINVDHWSAFVAERSSPQFLVSLLKDFNYLRLHNYKMWMMNLVSVFQIKRVTQQETRKKNKYPHRISRKGYANLEEELVSQTLRAFIIDQLFI